VPISKTCSRLGSIGARWSLSSSVISHILCCMSCASFSFERPILCGTTERT
jgi:hypothetical protein